MGDVSGRPSVGKQSRQTRSPHEFIGSFPARGTHNFSRARFRAGRRSDAGAFLVQTCSAARAPVFIAAKGAKRKLRAADHRCRNSLTPACLSCIIPVMHSDRLHILCVGAHPDDCEFRCGGVAALWAQRGHEVCFVSMTSGGAGHHETGGAALVQRRIREAEAAAAVIGIHSIVLPNPDGMLEPSLACRLELIRLIRRFGADLIITNRPNDYHPDHRYTSQLVQDSAFMLTVPQVAPDVPALPRNPVILYWYDSFQKPAPFHCDLAIDIDPVFDSKLAMLHCHQSQVYEWLPWLAGRLGEVPADDAARKTFLRQWYEQRHKPSLADRYREQLIVRYGRTRGRKIRQAEVFEVSEYGSALDRAAMERLFADM